MQFLFHWFSGISKSFSKVYPNASLPHFPCPKGFFNKNSQYLRPGFMKIAQPSYLMAPNLPRSSLFTFKGFVSILMLWSPTDICARILHHVSLLWSLLLLESAAPCLAIISLGTYWVYQNLVQVATPDGNMRVLEITFSHRPLQHPAVTLWACSTEAFSMEIYHHRYWNILQISHKVFGDGLGFPVSSGISNHKAISCVRCSMWQVILLTESRNDPHNIWGCTTVPDDGFLQAKFIAPFQLPSIKPLNNEEQNISSLHKCILKLPGCCLFPGAADTSLPPKQYHHWASEISL